MKIVKYLFFLALIAIIGASVYYGTKEGVYDVSASKELSTPVALIFEKANDLKQWPVWGPWSKNDPDMKVVFSAITKGEGASYSWESEVEGDGSLTTDSLEINTKIDQTIIFKTPFGESKSHVYWNFSETESGGTAVTWGMKGEHSFLEKIMLSSMDPPFEEQLKYMFEEGLDAIDKLVEKEMSAYSIAVEGIKEYGGSYYLYTTTASTMAEMGERMATMLGKVYGFAQKNNITITGMPFTIYNEWDAQNGTAIYSTALPVNERIIITEGDVLCGYRDPGTALKIVLKGNYTYLSEAYQRGDTYIAAHQLVRDASLDFFEIYATDPGEFPNPADWITEIYIPVIRDLRPQN